MLFRLPSLLLAASAMLLSACSNDDKSSSSLTGFDNSIYSHLTATAYTVCAQTKTGIMKCWGDGGTYSFADGLGNVVGDDVEETGAGILAAQLGDGEVEYAMASSSFGCAVYADGVLKCWGSKGYLGLDDPANDASPYVGDRPEELGNNLHVMDRVKGLRSKP